MVTDTTGVAPEAAPEGAATEVDEFAPLAAEPESFPKDYVTKLRQSGAKYRTELREAQAKVAEYEPLAGAFEGYSPEEAQGWQNFISQARVDPQGAIGALMQEGYGLDREGATALLDTIFEAGGETAPTPEAPTGDPNDPNRPMTVAEFHAAQAEAEQQRHLEAEVGAVQHEAQGLGYDPSAVVGSPEEYRYTRLLHIAANNTAGDLSKAHEALVAEEQATVQSHLARMAAEANGSPAPTGGNGGPGEAAGGPPKDWNGAKASALEYVRSRSNA